MSIAVSVPLYLFWGCPLNTNLGYSDKLQLAGQEEGRIRPLFGSNSATPVPVGFEYDYFVKDHLGNVRMVLTEEIKQDIYPAATLEGDINNNTSAAYIEKSYYAIDAAKISDKTDATGITDYPNHNGNPPVNNNPNSNTTAYSTKLYKLKATTAEGVTGLGITLKVMAGDKIDIFGKSYYFTNVANGTTNNKDITTLSILAGLLGGPTGGTAAAAHGGVTDMQLNAFTNTTDGIAALFSDQLDEVPNNSSKPRAFINYIFFDEQFKSVASGFDPVGANSVVKPHHLQQKVAPKNGYVYIYVSNQSQVDVFFDNLQVIHTRGAILEETHYYPFGLTMAGISSKALAFGNPENKYGFNNTEFQDELALNMYAMDMRQYDPSIARWVVQDPVVHFNYSSYSAFDNNPILWSDPSGANATCNTCGESSDVYGRERYDSWGRYIPPYSRASDEGNPIIDKLAITALKETSKLYMNGVNVSNLTESDKQKIFETDELGTIGILLWEFATGRGEQKREFVVGTHPFANKLIQERILGEILNEFNIELQKIGYDFAGLKDTKYVPIDLEFSPTKNPSTWLESLRKHLNSNSSQFFVGGATANVAIQDKNLIIQIINQTSRSSLMLHIAEDYTREHGRRPLSTITQFIYATYQLRTN